ncbi:LPXTG cell wall anchor domain-containing protein [Vagococcus jeotgali]|uniref:LPXTG cell wall anchor domain-containing protein n=1 Tax=Vagococcus jeotgali TaxID=3109030 RepID=UPI002DDA311E|nr:LPXTG cell wall anchor domain-containing protein [Vagococcus sp. B2T-5]
MYLFVYCQGNKEKLQSESVISDDNGKFTLKIQEKLLEGDKVVFTFTKDKATYTLTETVKANKDVNDVSGKGDAGTPPPKKGGKGNSGNHSSSGNASGATSSGGNRGTDNLPKTGESKAKLTVIGVVVLMSGAGVYIYNKRQLAK